jgi:hypothetical protein
MPANDTAGRGSKYAVVARIVASNAADQRTLQTTFGLRRNGSAKSERNRGACHHHCFHSNLRIDFRAATRGLGTGSISRIRWLTEPMRYSALLWRTS